MSYDIGLQLIENDKVTYREMLKLKLDSLSEDIKDIEEMREQSELQKGFKDVIYDYYLEKPLNEYKKIEFWYKQTEVRSAKTEKWILKKERAKQYPITDICFKLGLEIKQGFMKCPYHTEDTASCKIYEKDNHFHCFGCGKTGDVIDLVMQVTNRDFKQAVYFLS